MTTNLKIKICLNKESNDNGIPVQEEEKGLEYMQRGEQEKDNLKISKDKKDPDKFYILIECKRTKDIPNPVEEKLYTIRSTYQFEIFKALAYCWIKYGKFSILTIYLNNRKIASEKENLFQYFETENPFNNMKPKNILSCVDKILNINNDHNNFLTALGYQLTALSDFVSFDYSWRCFNHIYNIIYMKKIGDERSNVLKYAKGQIEKASSLNFDKDDAIKQLNKIIKQIAKKTNNVTKKNIYSDKKAIIHVLNKEIEGNQSVNDIALESKNFIINQLPSTRLTKWIKEECRGNKDSFKEKTYFSKYTDPELKERLVTAFNEVSKQKIDFGSKSNFDNKPNNSDYLICVYLYAYYLRNKFFHGEYRNQLLIFKKDQFINELRQLSKIIIDNNWILLDQYYQNLVDSNYDSLSKNTNRKIE